MVRHIYAGQQRVTPKNGVSTFRKAYTSGGTFPAPPRSWPRYTGFEPRRNQKNETRRGIEYRNRPKYAIRNRDPAASCRRVGALLSDAGVIVESAIRNKDMRPCQTWVDTRRANMSPNDALHVAGPRSEHHYASSLFPFSLRWLLPFPERRRGGVADARRLAASRGKLGSNRTCDRCR